MHVVVEVASPVEVKTTLPCTLTLLEYHRLTKGVLSSANLWSSGVDLPLVATGRSEIGTAVSWSLWLSDRWILALCSRSCQPALG